jgi:hypothetical protein
MLLVDTQTKAFIQDVELKSNIAKLRPCGEWLSQQVNIKNNLEFNRHFKISKKHTKISLVKMKLILELFLSKFVSFHFFSERW